jgi:hypothetical protein
VFNQHQSVQNCKLWLKDFEFVPETEQIKTLKPSESSVRSAKKSLLFSPKNFTIDGIGQQNVKFRARREINPDLEEKRALLAVMCKDAEINDGNSPQNEQVIIKPSLVHNVPIYVRNKGAKTSFAVENIEVDNSSETISFKLLNQSNQTTWGKFIIEDEKGQRHTLADKFTLYPETKEKQISFVYPVNVRPLKLIFQESEIYGGHYKLETMVN